MTLFEFVTPGASGMAIRGEVVITAGSIINTCELEVEHQRLQATAIAVKDPITVWMVPDYGFSRFEVFRGVVSRISPLGQNIAIEAATLASVASLDASKVLGWQNSSVSRILRDLLGMSRLDVSAASWPSDLSDKILHVWHTEGLSVADEIASLLSSVSAEAEIFGGPDGRVYIGDRDALSAQVELFPWPFDVTFGETDADACRFPPRPAKVYSVAFDPQTNGFMGTIDVVRHTIDESGASTTVLLNDADSEALQARLEGDLPPIQPLVAPSAEDGADE